MKKILIIDDDQLVSNIYRNKFNTEGFQVEVAHDGEVGFNTLKSFQPDLVLLDLMLPKVSGIDLLKQIRAEKEFKQLPIIVFSNTYLSNLVQEAWKAGATKCLSKASATPKQVIDVVRSTTMRAAAAQSPTNAAEGVSGNTKFFTSTSFETNSGLSGTNVEMDAAYQVDLQKSFNSVAPATLSNCRQQLQSAAKGTDDPARVRSINELYRLIHNLTANAAIASATCVAQVSDALEALLKELCDKPKNINPSTLRTIASTIDFLGVLIHESTQSGKGRGDVLLKPSILVVDDEAISRRAISYALEKAKLPCVSLDNPEAALTLLNENTYDLVFLDVDMPRINGFELCSQLRSIDRNKNTPVVFVTGLSGFENRANSIMSGGNDLIAKPFLFMELAVKALVFILKGRTTTTATSPSKPFTIAAAVAA